MSVQKRVKTGMAWLSVGLSEPTPSIIICFLSPSSLFSPSPSFLSFHSFFFSIPLFFFFFSRLRLGFQGLEWEQSSPARKWEWQSLALLWPRSDYLLGSHCVPGDFREQTVESYLKSSDRSINGVCRLWSRWKLALFWQTPWNISLFYCMLGFYNRSFLNPSLLDSHKCFLLPLCCNIDHPCWLFYSKYTDPDASRKM